MESIKQWVKQPQNYVYLVLLVGGVLIASRRYSFLAIGIVVIVAAFVGLLVKKVFYKD